MSDSYRLNWFMDASFPERSPKRVHRLTDYSLEVLPKEIYVETNMTALMLQGMMKQMSEERTASAENMRLGEFIELLEKCDQSLPVTLEDGTGLEGFDSYRGYYEDLSLQPGTVSTVAEVLKDARAAVGSMFHGYKGGDFWMTKNTILWVAPYGSCGSRLAAVRIEPDRVIVETIPDDL